MSNYGEKNSPSTTAAMGSGYSSPLEKSLSIEAGVVDDAAADDLEVFKKGEGIDFRTVGWIKASVIFLKSMLHLSTERSPLLTVYFSHLCYWCSCHSNCHV
jgi:hypothetical protein